MKFNIYLTALISFFLLNILNSHAQITQDDLDVLKGEWKLDMSPQDDTDSNFAWMKITKIDQNSVEGEFYRESVAIREGRVNTQNNIIYVALMSGDNSGEYNSSFYLKDGKLYGSTHAVQRGFLAVWTATKMK